MTKPVAEKLIRIIRPLEQSKAALNDLLDALRLVAKEPTDPDSAQLAADCGDTDFAATNAIDNAVAVVTALDARLAKIYGDKPPKR